MIGCFNIFVASTNNSTTTEKGNISVKKQRNLFQGRIPQKFHMIPIHFTGTQKSVKLPPKHFIPCKKSFFDVENNYRNQYRNALHALKSNNPEESKKFLANKKEDGQKEEKNTIMALFGFFICDTGFYDENLTVGDIIYQFGTLNELLAALSTYPFRFLSGPLPRIRSFQIEQINFYLTKDELRKEALKKITIFLKNVELGTLYRRFKLPSKMKFYLMHRMHETLFYFSIHKLITETGYGRLVMKLWELSGISNPSVEQQFGEVSFQKNIMKEIVNNIFEFYEERTIGENIIKKIKEIKVEEIVSNVKPNATKKEVLIGIEENIEEISDTLTYKNNHFDICIDFTLKKIQKLLQTTILVQLADTIEDIKNIDNIEIIEDNIKINGQKTSDIFNTNDINEIKKWFLDYYLLKSSNYLQDISNLLTKKEEKDKKNLMKELKNFNLEKKYWLLIFSNKDYILKTINRIKELQLALPKTKEFKREMRPFATELSSENYYFVEPTAKSLLQLLFKPEIKDSNKYLITGSYTSFKLDIFVEIISENNKIVNGRDFLDVMLKNLTDFLADVDDLKKIFILGFMNNKFDYYFANKTKEEIKKTIINILNYNYNNDLKKFLLNLKEKISKYFSETIFKNKDVMKIYEQIKQALEQKRQELEEKKIKDQQTLEEENNILQQEVPEGFIIKTAKEDQETEENTEEITEIKKENIN